VRRAPGVWWTHVRQAEADDPEDGARLLDLAAAALAPLRALGAEVAATALALGDRPDAAALDAYGALQAAFEARGGYAADRRLAEALDRVGLADAAERAAAAASGGERRRARLAGALAAGVDVLLLDEPTNHLDLEARSWLGQRLLAHAGAVVFASHDRALIDAVATHVLVLGEPGPHRVRRGGWSAYVRDRAHADASDAKAAKLRARRVAELEAMAAELRAQGHRTAQVRRRRAEREAATLRAEAAPTPGASGPRIALAGAAVAAGGEVARFDHLTWGAVLDDAALTLHAGERLALVGPNGVGKSTLLRLIAGDLASEDPRARAWWRRGARVVHVDQLRRGLDDEVAPREALAAWVSEPRADGLLALVGLPRGAWSRPAATLSGGERARAAAALLMAREADVLLLDEPTNDLDLATIEALEGALAASPATIVIATHDARTIEALGAQVVTFEERRLVRWRGGLDGWRRGARRREPGAEGAARAAAALADDALAPSRGPEGEDGEELGPPSVPAAASTTDLAAQDAARTAADLALDDPLRWSERELLRWRERRRSLEEALVLDVDRRLPAPRPAFRTREGGWPVWADRRDDGLAAWLDGGTADGFIGGAADPAAAVAVRVLDADGRRVAHLVVARTDDRALAGWAWLALVVGAARLAFYVFDVDAVQVASDRPPGGGFTAWAPGWWWWPRAELERAEGWGRVEAPRPSRRRRRRRR
jgi:ATP-binding cassette subfamily F protein 3